MQFKATKIDLFYGSVMPYPFKRLEGLPEIKGHWGDTKDVDPQEFMNEFSRRLGHTLALPDHVSIHDKQKLIEGIAELPDAPEGVKQLLMDTYGDWPDLFLELIGNGYNVRLEPVA